MESAGRTERVALVRLGGRLFEVIVVLAAGVAMLYEIGVEITPVLAGLGVGGVAVALASQKTIENLFGGIVVIGDRPIRIGQICRVGTMTGTVEDIGLRSTRIRTQSRTVITVPNAELAAASVEDFGARDKILFDHAISLRYETTADQLRAVLEGAATLLRQHACVEPATVRVRLLRFAPSGVEIGLFAYVRTLELEAFMAVQEDLLLATLGLVETCGTALALPSQTTYIAVDGRSEARSFDSLLKRS
jgi:MscS family membrane protein